MRELLPANLVRVIVREWLCSKADVFNLLVHKIADKVAPVAQQEAARMICRQHFDNPWREIALELMDKIEECLLDISAVMTGDDVLWECAEQKLLVEETLNDMYHALNWAEERKMKLHADVDKVDDNATEKGGEA